MVIIEELYDDLTLQRMTSFANSLCETEKRAYAAIEAYKLGYGGVKAISRLFGMSPETIKRGREDLDDPSRLPLSGYQRHSGAGRKGVLEEQPGLDQAFDELVKSHLAGDPMNVDVVWTDLLPSEIRTRLEEQGFCICDNTVRSLL